LTGVAARPGAASTGGWRDRPCGLGDLAAPVAAPRGRAGAAVVGAVCRIRRLPPPGPAVRGPPVWGPVLPLPPPGDTPLPVSRLSALWFLATAGASALRRHRTTQPDWVRAPAGPPSADTSRPRRGRGSRSEATAPNSARLSVHAQVRA